MQPEHPLHWFRAGHQRAEACDDLERKQRQQNAVRPRETLFFLLKSFRIDVTTCW
jgi:hypothetical protein